MHANFRMADHYDQTLGEPLAGTGRYAEVAESRFRAPTTYQKLKVAEKHSPLSGHMRAATMSSWRNSLSNHITMSGLMGWSVSEMGQ